MDYDYGLPWSIQTHSCGRTGFPGTSSELEWSPECESIPLLGRPVLRMSRLPSAPTVTPKIAALVITKCSLDCSVTPGKHGEIIWGLDGSIIGAQKQKQKCTSLNSLAPGPACSLGFSGVAISELWNVSTRTASTTFNST